MKSILLSITLGLLSLSTYAADPSMEAESLTPSANFVCTAVSEASPKEAGDFATGDPNTSAFIDSINNDSYVIGIAWINTSGSVLGGYITCEDGIPGTIQNFHVFPQGFSAEKAAKKSVSGFKAKVHRLYKSIVK